MPHIEQNVIYGMYSGLALLMDIHHPDEPNGIGVVHASGSGWAAPLSLDATPLKESAHVGLEASPLVDAGYTIFTVNHRATPRFKYPAAVEDMQRAVRFVRYHAGDYDIDPERIGAIGGSSAGHLVCMLGTLDGRGDPNDESPINQLSADVQCVVARAAPTSFLEGFPPPPFLDIRLNPDTHPGAPEYRIAKEASPLSHVSADCPPFLLMHGEEDDLVPIAQSEKLAEALEEAGVAVELVRIPGAAHGPDFPGAKIPPDIGGRASAWFDKHLRGAG